MVEGSGVVVVEVVVVVVVDNVVVDGVLVKNEKVIYMYIMCILIGFGFIRR